jgi:hypothetical protein
MTATHSLLSYPMIKKVIRTMPSAHSPQPPSPQTCGRGAFALVLFLMLLLVPAVESSANEHIATFCIVARDAQTGDLGVAVQSKYFDVCSVVPHAKANIGALTTQARGNILYGAQGLGMLEAGESPEQTLKRCRRTTRGARRCPGPAVRRARAMQSRATCSPAPRWWTLWQQPSRRRTAISPPAW